MDSNENKSFYNKIGRIPCKFCKHKMRSENNLPISQFDDLCDHCKRHIDYKQEQLKCHCEELVKRFKATGRETIDRKTTDRETTERKTIGRETTEGKTIDRKTTQESLVDRIKDFFKSIVRSPRLVNRPRITSLINLNPFKSSTEPNLRGDIASQGSPAKYSGSEPYLAAGLRSDADIKTGYKDGLSRSSEQMDKWKSPQEYEKHKKDMTTISLDSSQFLDGTKTRTKDGFGTKASPEKRSGSIDSGEYEKGDVKAKRREHETAKKPDKYKTGVTEDKEKYDAGIIKDKEKYDPSITKDKEKYDAKTISKAGPKESTLISEKEGERKTQTKKAQAEAKSDETTGKTPPTAAPKQKQPIPGKAEDKKAKGDDTAAKATVTKQKPTGGKEEDKKAKSDETTAKTPTAAPKTKPLTPGKAEDKKAKGDDTAAKTTGAKQKPTAGKEEDKKGKSDETPDKTATAASKQKAPTPGKAEDKKAKGDDTAAKTTGTKQKLTAGKEEDKKAKSDDTGVRATPGATPKNKPPTAGKDEDKKAKKTDEATNELDKKGDKTKKKGDKKDEEIENIPEPDEKGKKGKKKAKSGASKTALEDKNATADNTGLRATPGATPKNKPPTVGKDEDKKGKKTDEATNELDKKGKKKAKSDASKTKLEVDELGQKEKTKGKGKSKSQLKKTDGHEVGADGDKSVADKALELSDKLNKEELRKLKEERENRKNADNDIMARFLAPKPTILGMMKTKTKPPISSPPPKTQDQTQESGYKRPDAPSKYLHVKKEKPIITPRRSELELKKLDALNADREKSDHRIIIGDKIFKSATRIPTLDEKGTIHQPVEFNIDYDTEPEPRVGFATSENKKDMEQVSGVMEGLICYALSDRTFIDKGYTKLPTEKIMRKINVFRMHPANAGKDWFSRNKHKNRIKYATGEVMATFDDEGGCQIYYKNGNLALDYYEAAEENAQQRIVIYSDGENELGQKIPATVLATFDHLGSGVVYDKKGNIRLKYNQNEGVVLDQSLGPYSKWKWHTLNDPPVLEQIMIDTNLQEKDPNILRECTSEINTKKHVDEEMLAIEFNNFIKERNKLKSKAYKPFKIVTKAVKINDQFSLNVMDQSKIHIKFREGSTNMKINVGMILDCNEIIDSETAEVGDVAISMDRKPARTDSLHALQKTVAGAQRRERARAKRDQKLHPVVEPCMSIEKMQSAASRPLRKPLDTYDPTNGFPHIVCHCVNNR